MSRCKMMQPTVCICGHLSEWVTTLQPDTYTGFQWSSKVVALVSESLQIVCTRTDIASECSD